MLRTLELKNFRRHEDLGVIFGEGLNVIRGPNEIGKSTLIEAALYALYGSRALRNSLAETVTWGHKENELEVRLSLRAEGKDFTFKRSKAGATVYSTECEDGMAVGGIIVTGQAEVAAYAAQLLGADAKTASLLMLASQDNLRGALADGPTAVSGLMSRLADFDLIDRIIENAQSTLLLGAETPIQIKLDAAQSELVEAQEALPDPEEADSMRANIAHFEPQLTELQVERERRQATMLEAELAYNEAQDALRVRQARIDEIARLKADLPGIERQHADALQASIAKPDPARIEQLRRLVADAAAHQRLVKLHQRFLALPAYPVVFWDEPKDSFDAEVIRVGKLRTQALSTVQEINGQVKALQGQRITSGKCPTCGHAARSDEHVREHNARLDAEIATLNKAAQPHAAAAAEHGETLEQLLKVQNEATRRRSLTDPLADYLDFDESVYPPRVTWKGEVPRTTDAAAVQAELTKLEASDRAAALAAGRAAALDEQIAALRARIAAAEAEVAALPVIDIEPLKERYNGCAATLYTTVQALQEAQASMQGWRDRLAELERALESAQGRVRRAQERVAEYEADLKKLAFNNALMKKLKMLKPTVTDFLWNQILAAVSSFFSTLRGEQSVVTKEPSGFKVNGQSVESLSGSTLDVLALAIRVALTKTFVPHASFIVLDEPAHGCDATRTSNVLGFLASVGFTQTILASHDELSESVADNVIALGV